MASLKEKIGYGFGDMSSSMFWKIFSAYLPIFSFISSVPIATTTLLMPRQSADSRHLYFLHRK